MKSFESYLDSITVSESDVIVMYVILGLFGLIIVGGALYMLIKYCARPKAKVTDQEQPKKGNKKSLRSSRRGS